MKEENICICCNKDKSLLISLNPKDSTFFMRSQGVCQECLKTKDITKVHNEYEIRKIKERLKDNKEQIKTLERELKSYEQ